MSAVPAHAHQGSEAWHQYRANKGNASELPALMGCSPWFPVTPYQLWMVKTGRAKVEENEAMRRGSRLEPAARAFYEDNFAEVYEPHVVASGRLSASLDGINFDGSNILEIKIPVAGRESELWRHVEQHDAPPAHYLWQVQQQLLCSGAKRATFVVFHAEGDEIDDCTACYVWPDLQMHEAIKGAWAEFFEHLDADTPPPLTDKDVRERDDSDWRQAVAEWKAAKALADDAAAKEKEARAALLALTGDQSSQGAGVKATRYFVAGGYDYAKAAKESGLDVSQYEKKGRWQWRLTTESE